MSKERGTQPPTWPTRACVRVYRVPCDDRFMKEAPAERVLNGRSSGNGLHALAQLGSPRAGVFLVC